MIVYRGPRDALGGVRTWGGVHAGTLALLPNSTKNKRVCMARVLSLLCCPGSPLPETTIAWASPGPVMRARDGPFASAGAASVKAAAMLMPVARAATTVSLRSIWAPSVGGSLLLHRRPARCQCAEPAMASAAALPRLPSRRSATCPVPQIRVLPVVSRAEAAVGVPSRVTYTSSCGPLIHNPLAPLTSTLVTLPE